MQDVSTIFHSPAFIFLVNSAIFFAFPSGKRSESPDATGRVVSMVVLSVLVTAWIFLPGLGFLAILASLGAIDLPVSMKHLNNAFSGGDLVFLLVPNTMLLFGMFSRLMAVVKG